MKKINFTDAKAKKLLPKRYVTGHKALYGKALVVGGAPGMLGAMVLCAKAASRMGSGYVYVHSIGAPVAVLKNPDFLTLTTKEIDFQKFSAIAFGCGIGNSSAARRLLKKLIQDSPEKVVLDADALNHLSQMKNINIPGSWILTPHEGELGRLLGMSAQQVRENRETALLLAVKKYKCHVLLKGMPTLVSDGNVICKVNSGNAALSKAGTGDVLTGIICGLLAQGVAPLDAATLGAHIHGNSAALWLKDKKDVLSLLASDLLDLLPRVIFKLRK